MKSPKLSWELIDKILIESKNENTIKVLLQNKRYYILSTKFDISWSVTHNEIEYTEFLINVKKQDLYENYFNHLTNDLNTKTISYLVSKGYYFEYNDFLRKDKYQVDYITDIFKLKFIIDNYSIINLRDLILSKHMFKFKLIKYYITSKNYKIKLIQINKQIDFIDNIVWSVYTLNRKIYYEENYSDYDILNYMLKNYDFTNTKLNVVMAIRYSIKTYKYENELITNLHIKEAIKFNHLHILEIITPLYLKKNKITYEICKVAIQTNNKQIINYIIEIYCNKKKFSKNDINMIIPIGNVQILQKIIPIYIKNEKLSIKNILLAIKTCNLILILYLVPIYLEKYEKINSDHILLAIKIKDKPILEYLVPLYLEKHEKININHINYAIFFTDISILEYLVPLYLQRCESINSRHVLNVIFYNSQLCILKYILENYKGKLTSNHIIQAIKTRQLNIIEYLINYGNIIIDYKYIDLLERFINGTSQFDKEFLEIKEILMFLYKNMNKTTKVWFYYNIPKNWLKIKKY